MVMELGLELDLPALSVFFNQYPTLGVVGCHPQQIADSCYWERIFPRLVDLARSALAKMPTYVILCGVSQGLESAVAIAAQEYQIPYYLFTPFPGYGLRWTSEDKRRLHQVWQGANEVIYINDLAPTNREEFVVAIRRQQEVIALLSDRIIALWREKREMDRLSKVVEKHDITIHNLWGSWQKYNGVINYDQAARI